MRDREVMRLPCQIFGYSAAEIAAAEELVAVAEDQAMHGDYQAPMVLQWLRQIAASKPRK